MGYYYAKKEDAQRAAEELSDRRIGDWKVELEPGEGWVIVLFPAFYDITEYGDRFEVRHPVSGRRLAGRAAAPRKAAAAPTVAKKAAAPRQEMEKVMVVNPGAIKLPWMKD